MDDTGCPLKIIHTDYAKRIPRQYGNYGNKYEVPAEHRVTAYCKPKKVNPQTTAVYDR